MLLAYSIIGMDRLIKKLSALGGNVQKALNSAVVQTTHIARGAAQANYLSGGASQADSNGGASGKGGITERYEQTGDVMTGIVHTNSLLAIYREFGTGPVGEANHGGISPNVSVSWSHGPWKYKSGPQKGKPIKGGGWIYSPDGGGTFFYTEGQPAHPFLYPASVQTRDVFQTIAEHEVIEAIAQMSKGGG